MPRSFPCTGCGGCCRLIGKILESVEDQKNPVLKYAVESFPYSTDEDGVCEKLVDSQCSVYENRPLLCKVDLLGDLLGKDKNEWYVSNAESCNKIIDLLGLPTSYKITDYDLIN